MTEKTFIVTHAKARAPIIIKGKNLRAALKKEGLNPDIWHYATELKSVPEENFG